MNDKKRTEELLRMEGIMAKGYGCAAKFAMHDTNLDLTAKGLYAYLCSLTGGGTTTWPLRDNVLRVLRIGKMAYYGALKQLTQTGYISISRKRVRGHWDRNIYTIVSNPKCYTDSVPEEGEAQLCCSGMLSAGFGMIPRLPMQDERMTIKEKALYAYMLCYANAGSSAFPKTADVLEHLQISTTSFQKYMRTLEALGYIVKEQRRSKAGTFGVIDYYICEQPSVPSPERKKTDMEQSCFSPEHKKPDTVNQDMEQSCFPPERMQPDMAKQGMVQSCFPPERTEPDTAYPDMKKPDTENQDSILNTIPINSQSISIPTEEKDLLPLPSKVKRTKKDSAAWLKEISQEIMTAQGIPLHYLSDQRKMTAALHKLIGYEKDLSWSTDAEVQRNCEIVFEALRLMCCQPKTKVRECYVEAWQVVEMLNAKCMDLLAGRPDMMAAFDFLIEAFTLALNERNAAGEKPLKYPVAYAKFVIWDALKRYERQEE